MPKYRVTVKVTPVTTEYDTEVEVLGDAEKAAKFAVEVLSQTRAGKVVRFDPFEIVEIKQLPN
jgi:hypothetical protein